MTIEEMKAKVMGENFQWLSRSFELRAEGSYFVHLIPNGAIVTPQRINMPSYKGWGTTELEAWESAFLYWNFRNA